MTTRLALAVLGVTIGSLVVTAAASLWYGESLADRLVRREFDTQLVLKGEEVERYIAQTEQLVGELAAGAGIADAATRFADAFRALDDIEDARIDGATARVEAFYRDVFTPALPGDSRATSWPSLVPAEDAAVYLQDRYVVVDEDPGSSEQSLVDDAGDGSEWSAVHRQLHPGLLSISQRLDVGDLLLIEPDRGVVVYSVAKRPDFGTSLDVGPYSGSQLANLVRAVRDDPEPGAVALADVGPYTPALGAPTGFMAAPVRAGNQLAAILVVDLPIDVITDIMTGDRRWSEQGLGETGESFLVGADGRMRSDSRQFLEDPSLYRDLVTASASATDTELEAMAALDTTISFQKVVDPQTLAEEAGAPEPVLDASNYLGRETLSAYRRLDIDDVSWFAASQQQRSEIEQPLVEFRRRLLVGVAVFVVAVTFAMTGWARTAFRPVRAIGAHLRRIHEGDASQPLELPEGTSQEFTVLTESVDRMLEASQRRQADLTAASERKLETLRSLLPDGVAERVEGGERELLDHVPSAAIGVVVFHGLGRLVQSDEPHRVKALLDDVIARLDAAAQGHGVEPVKLIGDSYHAGCGLSRPYLDSAPRVLAFVVEARDIVREAAGSAGLRAAAGIAVGSVSVGLTGSSLLIYDLWGEPVTEAVMLARAAPADEIVMTDAVRRLLPDTVTVEEWHDATGTAMWRIADPARTVEEVGGE